MQGRGDEIYAYAKNLPPSPRPQPVAEDGSNSLSLVVLVVSSC